MTNSSAQDNVTITVTITILFNDPNLDAEDLDRQALLLLKQLKDFDEIVAERVIDPNPPANHKGDGGFLTGLVSIKAKIIKAKDVLQFLSNRLSSKPIELEVEVDGNRTKTKIIVNNSTELEFAIKKAQEFINSQQ